MSVIKRTGAKGPRWLCYVYSPDAGRKLYFGSYATEKEARRVFRDRTTAIEVKPPEAPRSMRCRDYVSHWLTVHHGEHTTRPRDTTYRLNEQKLRQFVQDFGDRPLRDGITRGEALAWSRRHQHNATAVAAMFTDAFNDELTGANPFADRRQKGKRGRRDIHPITEAELERLAELARTMWGEYGRVVAGWILFNAWTGVRPGEGFKATWADLDFRAQTVRVQRVKPPYRMDVVVFPGRAQEAVLALPHREGLLFPSVMGRPMLKGHARYYFDPVRKAWQAELDPERLRLVLGGRPGFDPYALRHFAGSYLASRGCNEYEISQQLGNTPEVCRETYIHLYEDQTQDRLREALEGGRVASLAEARRRRGIA